METNNTPKSIEEIVKSYQKKSVEEIENHWKELNNNTDSICAVIPVHTYNALRQRTTKYPIFIIPFLRPDEGVIEFLYVEWKYHIILFTRLAEFKEFGNKSKPLLTVLNVLDLSESKEIVLMKGDVDSERISNEEAGIIMGIYQIFYLKDENFELVKTFNETPQKFNFEDLLKGLSNQ